MNDQGLVLCDVRKHFPGFDLGPLSLSLAPGRVHGLLGPNGAGKTTLLNLITLQARPSSGHMSFAGARIRWGDASWKDRFAYVREAPAFYGELTVSQTMAFAGRLYGHWDRDLALRMLAAFRLRGDQPVDSLSKGTRVKLGIVTALGQRADLLVLDEPTAGVDPDSRQEFHEILQELRHSRPRLCIILSSHIFEDLEASADDVLIMRGGQVVFQARREDLKDGRLAAAYRDTASPRREAS